MTVITYWSKMFFFCRAQLFINYALNISLRNRLKCLESLSKTIQQILNKLQQGLRSSSEAKTKSKHESEQEENRMVL